jgi:hypothetical protein
MADLDRKSGVIPEPGGFRSRLAGDPEISDHSVRMLQAGCEGGSAMRSVLSVLMASMLTIGVTAGGASARTTTTTAKPASSVARKTTKKSPQLSRPTTTLGNVSANSVTASGTVQGKSIGGAVASPRVLCAASGTYLHVTWSGTAGPTELAGDLNAAKGSAALGTTAIAGLVVNGDYKNRMAATGGTVTVSSDLKSAALDGQFVGTTASDKVHVKGMLRCP